LPLCANPETHPIKSCQVEGNRQRTEQDASPLGEQPTGYVLVEGEPAPDPHQHHLAEETQLSELLRVDVLVGNHQPQHLENPQIQQPQAEPGHRRFHTVRRFAPFPELPRDEILIPLHGKLGPHHETSWEESVPEEFQNRGAPLQRYFFVLPGERLGGAVPVVQVEPDTDQAQH
jgi:hypothetical protein